MRPTQRAGQGARDLRRREGDRSPLLHLDPGKPALFEQPRQLAQPGSPPLDGDGEAGWPLVCGASDRVRFRRLPDEEEGHRALGLLRSQAAPEARQLLAKAGLETVAARERQPREPQALPRQAPFGAGERVDRRRAGDCAGLRRTLRPAARAQFGEQRSRSEEHTSELQSLAYLVCRLLLEKKNNMYNLADIRLMTGACTESHEPR